MLQRIMRLPAAALLVACITSAGAGVFFSSGLAKEARSSAADLAARVDQCVRAWEPTAEERRFDEIGWARDIRDAERLAKTHHRPIFLFTHDGRIATARC